MCGKQIIVMSGKKVVYISECVLIVYRIIQTMKRRKKMTFEELEKEAKKWCKSKNLTSSNVGYFTADYCEQSYIAGAEPREKRIAELNKKLSKAEADYDEMFWNKNEIISEAKKQLTKAKEIIQHFVDECKMCRAYPEKYKMWYQEIAEAEAFLKEE